MKTSHPVWGREALTTPLLSFLNKSINPFINNILIKALYIGHKHIITATSGECNHMDENISLSGLAARLYNALDVRMIKRVFPILAISIFCCMLGSGIVVPLLPLYAESLGATGFWLGVIFAGFPISRALVTPFFGRLSDRSGRKPFISVGLLYICGYLTRSHMGEYHSPVSPGPFFARRGWWHDSTYCSGLCW